MKTRFLLRRRRLIKWLAACAGCLVAGLAAAIAQNLTIYDDDQQLENAWYDSSWATVTYGNQSPVESGSYSISVADNTSNYEALYLALQDPQNTTPYQSLNFWVYPTIAANDQIMVEATLGGTTQTASEYPLTFTAGQVKTWQQVTIPLASLGVANKPNFDGIVLQNYTGGPQTFYVDAISLLGVPLPSPVQLTVNAKTTVRTIDGRIYGTNTAIYDSLLPAAATNSLMSAIETQSLRFPGGSSADEYDWSTGYQKLYNGTTVMGSTQWGTSAANFGELVSSLDAQGYITVNYGSGTPQQAAAWVAYCNGSPSSTTAIGTDTMGRNWQTVGYWATIRASAPLATDDGYNFLRLSRPAPFAIKYWEVGNECYGTWETDLHGVAGSGLSGAQWDPYTYAQAFQSYSNAMTAVDSTIHLGAAAALGEDSYGIGTHAVANPNEGGSTHTGWVPVMLATMKSEGVTPAFLIYHCYVEDPGYESDPALLEDAYTIPGDAANIRKMITDYNGTTAGAGIELAMTELNSVTNTPTGKQTVSLVNALYMVDAIGQLAQTEFNACLWWDFRNGTYTNGNNASYLYGWRDFGDYGVVASGDEPGTPANTPYPTYYAAQLLTHWGRGGDVVVSNTSNYPFLSTYAARLANGNLSLLVVNKDPSNAITAQVGLTGFTPGTGSGTYYTYGKSNDTSETGLTMGTFAEGSTFSYTFPSYSMTTLLLTPLALVTGTGDVLTGSNALAKLTSGSDDTADGYQALEDDSTASTNTAVGYDTLSTDKGGFSNTAMGVNAQGGNISGNSDVAIGQGALDASGTSTDNAAFGFQALKANTAGTYNEASGYQALLGNTAGFENTATGYQALLDNMTGNWNTATGTWALHLNSTGGDNTASGVQALYLNTSGSENSANGFQALYSNSTGNGNTATGSFALWSNQTGSDNTATGANAMLKDATGSFDTAGGADALVSNGSGGWNTAEGDQAMNSVTTGSCDTAVGASALVNGTSGSNDIAIGYNAGTNVTSGSDDIEIGTSGTGNESRVIRIGKGQRHGYIAGISGKAPGLTGVAVVIDANGNLGTVNSSIRYKEGVEPMGDASDALLKLKPVKFQYRSDAKGTPQYGLIAEQVARVAPHLTVRNAKGKLWTVRYDAINAMLLNEFLEEQKQIEDQETEITSLEIKSGQLMAMEIAIEVQRKQNAALEAANAAGRRKLVLGAAEQQQKLEAAAALRTQRDAAWEKIDAKQRAEIEKLAGDLKEQARLIDRVRPGPPIQTVSYTQCVPVTGK